MSHLTEKLNQAERKASSRAGLILPALAALFVLYLLLIWVSEVLSRRPGIALILNPWNATALVNRAEAALNQDPPDLAAARRYAERALRADPLAPRVYRVLGRVAEEENNEKAELVFDTLAGRFARDGEAQFDLVQRALRDRSFKEAVHRLDILYRGQGRGRDARIAQLFANAINDPDFASAYAQKLAENPPWRRVAVEQTIERAASVDVLIDFFTQLASPRESETRQFMERLVREGRFGTAHAVFLNQLPAGRVSEAALLYNARFQYGVSNMPFDWVISRMPNTLTEVRRDRNRRLLRVTFFGGRTPYRNVSHLMALAPGDYIFSGTEQAIALNNPRGMRWRVACADRPDQNLATSELLAGDVGQRPFSVRFTVPDSCPYQVLELELAYRVALEQEATGSVVYSDLDLTVAVKQQ